MASIIRKLFFPLALMGGLLAALHADEFVVPAKTTAPFTYCIWYLPDPEKEAFLKDLAASPPDLFHLGYHIPFKGALGPTYGHELFTDDILAPDQIPREVNRIKSMLKGMRDAGVKKLIPYVYTMAFFGRPEERTGFFRFFDHWQDYCEYGLGHKPDADPTLWTQVTGPQQLGGGPAGILHYEPCINQPPWAKYLDLVVGQAAEVGYDGMFFDVNTLYCYCPHCQEKFDIYLLKKYGRKGLREIFGSDDHRLINLSTMYRDFEKTILSGFNSYLVQRWVPEKLTQWLGVRDTSEVALTEDWRLLRCYMQGSQGEFPPLDQFKPYLSSRFGADQADGVEAAKRKDYVQVVLRHFFLDYLHSEALADLLKQRFGSADIKRRCCANPKELMLWVETQRFWCQSMADQFRRLKQVGQATLAKDDRQEEFYTVANLGSMATMDALKERRVDAIDLPTWAPVANLQMFEEMQQPGSLESGVIINNVLAFRWAMAAGTRAGTLLYKSTSERAADLSEAEVAAGGGGAFIQTGVDAPQSRAVWKRFFSEHSDLWDQGSSWVQVGLLYWNDQVFYEYPEHNAIIHRLVKVLSESQIPFDLIAENGLDRINHYRVIIAPKLRYLGQSQVEALLAFARQGGRLVIIEPFASEDPYARPQQLELPKRSYGSAVAFGKGTVLWLADEEVPQRRSDLWCLMEERSNAYLLARDYLNQTRAADLAQQVDLGPQFVQRLENTLHWPLRWCPEKTDPGIYLHAYRVPAKGKRPERIVLHAVNYHIPILIEKGMDQDGEMMWSSVTKSGEPVISRDLVVAVPLPEGLRLKEVRALSPVDRIRPINWRVTKGKALLTVEQLAIYQAVCLDLE